MCHKIKSRRETKVFLLEEISIFLSEAQQTVIQMEEVCEYLKKENKEMSLLNYGLLLLFIFQVFCKFFY